MINLDQIVVLKNSKKGIVVDTLYNQNDTLFIDFSNKTNIEIPSERLDVNTFSEKDAWDIIGIIAAIVAAFTAIIGSYIAIRQLIRKDQEKQNQLDELRSQTNQLIKQNELHEKRIRLTVQPDIWSNGHGIRPYENRITVDVNNRGNIAFVDEIVLSEGHGVRVHNWNQTIPIEKDGRIIVQCEYDDDIQKEDLDFKFIVKYYDQGAYRYETKFHWVNQKITQSTKFK